MIKDTRRTAQAVLLAFLILGGLLDVAVDENRSKGMGASVVDVRGLDQNGTFGRVTSTDAGYGPGVACCEDEGDVTGRGTETVPAQVVTLAHSVVDLIVENLIEGKYARFFAGSSTVRFVKPIILDRIEGYFPDDIMIQGRYGLTDDDRSALADEVYWIACIYYDAIAGGGASAEEAHRLAVVEGIRYILVEFMGYPEEEALKYASDAYDAGPMGDRQVQQQMKSQPCSCTAGSNL